jgi:type I restriction enzyme S subunit
MDAERLLEHFDHIAEAPDAVTQLRRFIFDLAVRGKLVEQDPSDEPASEWWPRCARPDITRHPPAWRVFCGTGPSVAKV